MSILIFFGLVTAVLSISYIIYKVKGGGKNPVSKSPAYEQTKNSFQAGKVTYRNIQNNFSNQSSFMVTDYGTTNYTVDNIKYYKRPKNTNTNCSNDKLTSVPRLQIMNNNKSTPRKKIMVVSKYQNYHNKYESDKILNYYSENGDGVFIKA